MRDTCSHCKRQMETEQVALRDGEPVRLCPDCMWQYANMGWLAENDRPAAQGSAAKAQEAGATTCVQ